MLAVATPCRAPCIAHVEILAEDDGPAPVLSRCGHPGNDQHGRRSRDDNGTLPGVRLPDSELLQCIPRAMEPHQCQGVGDGTNRPSCSPRQGSPGLMSRTVRQASKPICRAARPSGDLAAASLPFRNAVPKHELPGQEHAGILRDARWRLFAVGNPAPKWRSLGRKCRQHPAVAAIENEAPVWMAVGIGIQRLSTVSTDRVASQRPSS